MTLEEKNGLKGNVLVIGNSGVGKSTLINAVLGVDRAETGWGTGGTTRELKIYESTQAGFRLIDSVGFEPSFFKERQAVSAVQKWSKNSAKDGAQDSRIHVIWFCVDGTSSKLFAKNLKNLSRATSMWPSVPVLVVITKSYSVPDREKNKEMVLAAFAAQTRHPVTLRGVIPVVAETYVLNDSAYAPPEGIDELISRTNDILPDGIRASEKDVSQFRLNRKRALSHGVVGAATVAGITVGAVPIPFSDALLLGPTELAEVNAIAKVYGIQNNEESKRFLNSIIEVGTVGAAAKAAISALKAIPGINLGASVINAVIAGGIVAALGEGCIYVFEQIYLGNKTTDDIDWMKKVMESEFSSSFVEKLRDAMENITSSSGKESIASAILDMIRSKQS